MHSRTEHGDEIECDGKLHKVVAHSLMNDENREHSKRVLSCSPCCYP